ncbi:hypothetical protein CcaverHIS002_0209100 [Cutaneotrichosporon cavernicola]|uniref:Exonuclease V n=1 Tax=Cutaneotrichosporon cavernicola TaxID=279322 RepID=A0AA48I4L6_9TREE|nr:uncharacterized protein CcaverHIS019_0209110 [Cutaneotrichosporon cavernicola]BEI81750.1 hypothetical protein CcaverHIS002_0209100 [Cutaneotrichosporon cavernicola]BEI89549.1 hypothetical protein CcaverHIS019_0209110 [Cutaneotrichosporon cavernicola]BEI97322.1 hypothetical protein CcaverHIS631_0209110 [Cutaneotrichosporon cavernicola]BEJ05096.1 hypothetical protein CcaverHIS641_0209130 [Cutaneotrichosporon cavernicola]
MPATDEEDDYGDELVYDSGLDETLRAAEAVPDIEDVPLAISPFGEFRHRGNLSVSDLVGPVWCEVQFDYRLRTLPYLPVSQRPTTIISPKGASISVDQAKVEGKERILRRGERLEREIHPEEIKVQATTREDTWGLRMLNMFSALEALLTIGKCRELPVAGFVDDTFVLGIIDEITRVPIVESPTKGRQTRAKRTESGRQASLNDFFGGKPLPQPQTHRLIVSDSKTRTTASMPREEDTLAGRLQVMLYKELIDALLVPHEPRLVSPKARVKVEEGEAQVEVEADPPHKPPEAYLPTSSEQGSGLWRIWDHLGLDTSRWFTDEFIAQTCPVVESNELRFGVAEGRTLADYAQSWTRYVAALGLGAGTDEGRTDTSLELVYRRAAPKRKKEAARKRRKGTKGRRRKEKGEAVLAVLPSLEDVDIATLDEETQVQLALQLSMQDSKAERGPSSQILRDARLVEITSSSDGNEPSMTVYDPGHVLAEGPRSQNIEATYDTGDEPPLSEPPLVALGMGSPSLADRPSDGESQVEPLGHPLDSPPSSSALGLGKPTVSCSCSQRSVSSQTKYFTSDSEQEREDAELAWAVEMSLGTGSQETAAPSGAGVMSPSERKPRARSPSPGTASGSIIGKHRFTHDRAALGTHLRSVLQYWRGTRRPLGVSTAQVRRCHWCEFEEGCEWRQTKAGEALERYRSQRMS